MKNYCHIALLTGVLFGCVQPDGNEITKLQEANIRLSNELTYIRDIEKIGNEIFRRTVKYENSQLENTLVYWGKDTVHTIQLNAIATKAKLVFCFSTNTCSPCINATVDMLKEQFSDFETNETIIVAGDYPLRLRDNCYGKRMLGGIILPLAEIEAPFFFVLDNSLTLSHLHIYNKTKPELTKIYIQVIKNKLINASAESFNAKIKAFRAFLRGITDIKFFLFRLANIYA